MFSKKQLRALLIPLMIEQVLTSLMGTVDTMMVSTAGSAAISAVSLVDTINVLIIQIFTAIGAGGTIVCAQYMGRGNDQKANNAGSQLMLTTILISGVLTILFVVFRVSILKLIFGSVDTAVMDNARVYLLITALSFPFIALYTSAAALFRGEGNSALPMRISTVSNLINVGGNAVLIFGFHMGATGAALATLVSRVFSAAVIMYALRRPDHKIVVKGILKTRPDRACIGAIMRVGVPNGIENGMFHFGKLAIQSTISSLGTVALAGHAMAASVELLTSNAQTGVGYGLMTIVGQCMGAGRVDEARAYILKLTRYASIITLAMSIIFSLLIRPITVLAAMESEAAELAIYMVYVIGAVKIFAWNWAYIPAYGMRAAGDVRFSMCAASIIMWVCRVLGIIVMVRVLHWGIMSAWYGMFLDWTVKSIVFYIRFRSGKWTRYSVLKEQ